MAHRTKLKMILNPILRKFGWSIVSVMNNDVFIKYKLRRYPENCPIIKKDDESSL
jgi:hypothetical protein